MSVDAGEMKCARHPKVETRLGCGRCETPICPRCLVMTDVGARCPDCAPRRRLPQFEVNPVYLLRGLGAAAGAGIVLGLAWGLLAPGDYGLFLGILFGIGLGYAAGEAVSLATNRKTVPVLAVMAALAVLGAYLIRNVLWVEVILPGDDLYGYIVTVVGMFAAAGRLRF
jgi:hypothetical protein